MASWSTHGSSPSSTAIRLEPGEASIRTRLPRRMEICADGAERTSASRQLEMLDDAKRWPRALRARRTRQRHADE